MEAILEALNALYEWVASGVYTFFVDLWAWVALKAMTWWFDALLWKLTFVWDVASEVISSLGVANEINARLAALEPNSAALVRYAKVPEALNLVATAGVSNVLLRFVA